MKRETFLSILSMYDKEKINQFIRENGKRRKPIKPLVYPDLKK